MSNSRAVRIGFSLPKASLKLCFQEFFPGVKQVPPIQTNKSRVGLEPRWERQSAANSTNSLENESKPRSQGDQGRVTGLIGLHSPRPGLLAGMNTPPPPTPFLGHLSLCPSIFHYLSEFGHSRPLPLWEFYCPYLTAALN